MFNLDPSDLKMQICCVVWLEITFLTWTNFKVVCFNWIVWNKIVCRVFLSTQQFSISSGVWIIQPNTFTKCTGVCFNWPVCYIWNQRVTAKRQAIAWHNFGAFLFRFSLCTVGRVFFSKLLWPLLLFSWLKWARYLAVAGLNLLPLLFDRVSPFGV